MPRQECNICPARSLGGRHFFFCATLVMTMSGAIIGVEVEIRPNAVPLRLQMCGQKPFIDNKNI